MVGAELQFYAVSLFPAQGHISVLEFIPLNVTIICVLGIICRFFDKGQGPLQISNKLQKIGTKLLLLVVMLTFWRIHRSYVWLT